MSSPVSIRQSLLRNLILVILLLGASVLATTVFAARRSVKTLSAALIDSTIDQTELKLREFFEPVHGSLHVAREWGVRGMLDIDDRREHLDRLFVPVLDQFPQISSVIVADSRGHEYMLLRTADGWTSRQTRADEWGNQTLWHTWNRRGGDFEQEWRELEYDPRTRPWYIGAIQQSSGDTSTEAATAFGHAETQVHWTQPYRFFTTRDPGITASLTFDSGDEHTHVIAFDVLLSSIADYTSSMVVSPNGGLMVLTDDGRIVGLPRVSRYIDPEARRADLLKRPAELDWELVHQVSVAFDAMAEDSQARSTFRAGGQRWWGGRRPFALTDNREFRIVVVVPESDMLGTIPTMRLWIVAILIVVLTGAMWRAIVLARRFSQPIEALVEQSNRISRGDLDPDEPIESSVSEVNQLAEAHERMREGLKSLFKLERDLQLARQIQQSTFPEQLPIVEGFDLAAWNEPADETGGDSYDIIGIQDGIADRTAKPAGAPHKTRMDVLHADAAIMLLADATGHGIGPALSATQIRAMLRMAVRLDADLQSIASHLNEQLTADMPESRFITAWLGQIDSAAGTLTSFSAGQGPILLYEAATQSIRRIVVDAPPFGITTDMTIELQPPIELATGDVVAVLSDGIFEARNDRDEQLGIDRVQDILAAHHSESAVQVLTAIRWALREFTGEQPHDDDQTAIIIKKT